MATTARVLYHNYYRKMRSRKGVNLKGYATRLEQQCVANAFATVCDVTVPCDGWRNRSRRQRFMIRREKLLRNAADIDRNWDIPF